MISLLESRLINSVKKDKKIATLILSKLNKNIGFVYYITYSF